METLKALATRKSTREFEQKAVEPEKIRAILSAAMSGPSAVNARPWEFIVVTDKEKLLEMAEGNGRAANPLKSATLGILVCGNLQKAYSGAPDYWAVDASIACQNMILAAHDMGIGSVWLGTFPQENKIKAQSEIFDLPEHIVPHSIIAFGYPKNNAFPERDLYDENKVHFERW